MNSAYRDLILAKVQAAVGAARAAKRIKHKGLKGELREIIIRELFRPLLPADVGIGTGEIITADNRHSSQQDIIIYDKRILPPVLFEEHTGLFPIESVLYTVEMKSTLTRDELKSSHSGANELLSFVYQAGEYNEKDKPIDHSVAKVVSTIFALDTDLVTEGNSEVGRYDELREEDPPAIYAICVVDRGYWYWYDDAWRTWTRTYELEEVVGFVAGIMNTYRRVAETRKEPRIGRYLIDR